MNDINYKKLDVTPDGDFNLTDDQTTIYQNQDIIIQSDKGKIMQNLLLGVGVTKYLHGPFNIIEINRNIKTECKKDGITINNVQVINGELYIKTKI